MWNFEEANSAEELAEMAVSFLRHELEAEKALVVHGDEQHPEPVTQAFKALSMQDIDRILWDWIDISRESNDVCSRYGDTDILVAPLVMEDLPWFGLLYVEREKAFVGTDRSRLHEFATEYSRTLYSMIKWDGPEPESEAPPAHSAHSWAELRPLVLLDWF